MTEGAADGAQQHGAPLRITIEIDRPHVGLGKASGHMRGAVREVLLSLREVLDAGIQTLGPSERQATSAEQIKIE